MRATLDLIEKINHRDKKKIKKLAKQELKEKVQEQLLNFKKNQHVVAPTHSNPDCHATLTDDKEKCICEKKEPKKDKHEGRYIFECGVTKARYYKKPAPLLPE
jgi:hypothetical protein